jgi:hypothetical protein
MIASLRRATLALCGSAVMLAGCEKLTTTYQSAPIRTERVEGKMRGGRAGGEQVRVWRDPETGCQYLVWERRQRGAMTPRLRPDGRPMCGPLPAGQS